MRKKLENQKGLLASLVLFVVLGTAATFALAQGSGTRNSPQQPGESQQDDGPKVKAELNAQALMAMKNARVPMVLLDARGESEQWIGGAMPLAHDAEERAVRRALRNRDQLIVTYCGGPECPLSQMLADRLAEMGYSNVIRFTGGVEAWTAAEYELDPEKKDAPGSAPRPARPGSGSK